MSIRKLTANSFIVLALSSCSNKEIKPIAIIKTNSSTPDLVDQDTVAPAAATSPSWSGGSYSAVTRGHGHLDTWRPLAKEEPSASISLMEPSAALPTTSMVKQE